MRWVATFLTMALLLTFPSSALSNGKSKQSRVEVEGRVEFVDAAGGLIVVRGEKGRSWVVVVSAATEIKFERGDDDGLFDPADLFDLQPGDEVEVKGLRLSDGRILALKIEVEGDRPGIRVRTVGTIFRGVIVIISDQSFILITRDGNITVVIQMRTRIVKEKRPVPFRILGRHDVVLVRGVLSGKRILADEVEVEFDASEGVVLTGPIELLWLQGGAFLLAGVPIWVNVTSRTFIIQGQSATTLGSVRPNASVIVYGLGRGSTTQAMVVVVR